MTDDARFPADPDVVELAHLDREILRLVTRVEQAQLAWAGAENELAAVRGRRNEVVARLHARVTLPAPQPVPVPVSVPAPRPLPAAGGGEASTRTFQNLLFVLGGLLLSIAAVVFTAVAWTSYGVTGRAVILGIATALALAAPLVALWRRLRATAETFAGVGLLLVVLDGYAIWDVNLFGVNDLPTTRYTGLVCAVTAAVAAGYGRLTTLVGPTFVAVIVAQPAIPLLAAEFQPDAAGWSLVASAVVALDLAIVWSVRHPSGFAAQNGIAIARQVTGWAFAGSFFLFAGLTALLALGLGRTPATVAWAGLATIVAAATLVPAAALTGLPAARPLTAGGVTMAVLLAASRWVSVAWPDYLLVAAPAVVAAVAVLVLALRTVRPVWSGAAAATAIAGAVWTVVLAGFAVIAALDTVEHALPFWHAGPVSDPRYDWQLLAAVALIALALLVTSRSAIQLTATLLDIVVIAVFLAMLALPATVALPWWLPSIVEAGGAATLIVLAALTASPRRAAAPALAAMVLAAHAVLASLGRPWTTAVVLGVLTLAGLAAGAASGRAEATPSRRAIGGYALLVGLAALPPAVGAALMAASLPPWWAARLTCASVLLVVAGQVVVRRIAPPDGQQWRGYAHAAALVSAAIWPVVAAAAGGDPIGVIAGVGLVLVAATLLPLPPQDATAPEGQAPDGSRSAQPPWFGACVAAAPAAVLFAVDVVPAVFSVLAVPFAWLDAVWSGRPAGVGLGPTDAVRSAPPVELVHAVALALLALAAVTTLYAVRRTVRAALGGLAFGGPTAIIVALVATGARWPTVPLVTLLLGASILVVVGIVRIGQTRTILSGLQSAAYVGAGLSGTLSVKWSTLVGLGSIVVGASVVAVVGRSVAWRVGGWLTVIFAATATAAAAGLAGNLPLRQVAFATLGVAALALAANAVLAARASRKSSDAGLWTREADAVQAAAHAVAALSLLFTVGSIGYSALVCCGWGIAIGLRALAPHTGRDARATMAAAAAGCQLLAWWLLLSFEQVTLVEAYTVPAAAVALLAGWVALRGRPDLRSWVAYGPALAAAFLPSLALVLTGASGDSVWRRLLLGLGALAVVLAGAIRRRQAPAVVGGGVLALVGLHELALVWYLVPSWVPLAAGGALLVALAITYERRRRDLRWLRATLSGMQ